MANFGPKPWTNPLWKNLNFSTFSISCFYSLERRFFPLEYHKTHFPGPYCLKKKRWKNGLVLCVSLPGKNISLVKCFPPCTKHISLVICFPPCTKHICLVILVPPPRKHIFLLICVPPPRKHIYLVMLFPTRETYILCENWFPDPTPPLPPLGNTYLLL